MRSIKNLKMLLSSLVPRLPHHPLHTPTCLLKKQCIKNLLILSSLEREAWQRVELLGTYHCWFTQNYVPPPTFNVSFSLFLSGKLTLHPAKESCLYLPRVTLFKLYLGVSVVVKNSIRHVIGEKYNGNIQIKIIFSLVYSF